MGKTSSQELLLLLIDKLVIGVLIVIAAYFLNKLLEKYKGEQTLLREYESLRDQTTLNHIRYQIEDLYSPLLGLITQSKIVYEIAMRKLPHFNKKPKAQITDKEGEVWRYFVEKYFLPLNKQMAYLIRTKVYLVSGDEMPESFSRFLMHQAQFQCLHSLWRDEGVSSDEIHGSGWPKDFGDDVQRELTNLRKRHNEYLKRIERPT